MARRDQDMIEVQNRLGPRDPKEAALTITGEFLVVKALIEHLTDGMLDNKQYEFVKLIYKKFVDPLSNVDTYGKNIVQFAVTQLVTYIKPLQVFSQKYTKSIVGVAPDPGNFLDDRLRYLEAGLARLKQGDALLTNPLPSAMMSMGNFATAAMGNLSPLAPTGGFSNAGGTGNLGATTYGVLIDHFNQLKSRCASLEAEVKELTARREDATLEINSRSFALVREFDTFFNEDVLRLNSPGAADESAQLHVFFFLMGAVYWRWLTMTRMSHRPRTLPV